MGGWEGNTLWLCGLLFVSLTGAQGLSHFPEHFVVAKRNDANPVTLTCRTEDPGAVTWKFHGEALEDVHLEDNAQQHGHHLALSEVDTPMLGEYSCWRGTEMLSSTFLLLRADGEEESDSPSFSCWAKSYDCTFSCEWSHRDYTAVRLGLGRDCTEARKSCRWISGHRLEDGTFHWELSHPVSRYAEESTMLELTAEAIVHLSVARTTQRFYLRDIVKPDSPQIVTCQEGEDNLNVTVAPPPSWSTPHSFFSLEHQIEYILKDDGRKEYSSFVLLPKGVSQLRVRSRDSLVLSAWSEWTDWKNVITGKKSRCKCKNAATSCCPELPSGFLDNCKKRRKNKRKKH
ncbi:uncharacterized protein ACO6RY_04656 [Pungitius sinensis]